MLHSARNRRFAGVKVIQGLSRVLPPPRTFEFTFEMPTIIAFTDLPIPNQARTILQFHFAIAPIISPFRLGSVVKTLTRSSSDGDGFYFGFNRFRPNYERAGSSNSFMGRRRRYDASLSIDNNPGIISQRSFFTSSA